MDDDRVCGMSASECQQDRQDLAEAIADRDGLELSARSLELVLKAYMYEHNRLWWMLWDMFWGWLGAEIHLDVLLCLCEKHKIGAK